MNLKHAQLNDEILLTHTLLAAKEEKNATLVLLEYLFEVDRRKLYATEAYHSLFDFIVRKLGYSEPAAAERVNAIRLMQTLPQVKTHLEKGELTLTTASQIQRFIKVEEKVASHKVAISTKENLIVLCIGRSKREVERTLLSLQSAEAKMKTQEKVRPVSEQRTELKFTINQECLENLKRLQELKGNQSLESIFNEALKLLLTKEKNARGIRPRTQPAEEKLNDSKRNSRFVPIQIKQMLFERSKGQCEFTCSKTKIRCKSRFRLQIDHIKPYSLGGKTEFANLRHLCFQHNQRAAIESNLVKNTFGK